MKTLSSYVAGAWHTADAGFATLVDPCTEEPIAQASSRGVDFAAVLEHARRVGGGALRGLTIAQRGEALKAASRTLSEQRDALIALSMRNTGTTRRDAKFDVDGGIFTMAHYGELGVQAGERRCFVDGDGVQLGRSTRFWGQHVFLPRGGVAVHVNAFNFPVWGFAEKAACALLAGMPVVTKPATSSAWVAEEAVRAVIEGGALPEGALSLICGSTGDLLDRLGPQDVLAFTGSASTALRLRSKTNLLEASTRVNVEADSLNAAVLAPGVDLHGETGGLFLKEVVREMTQKTGQKCTAVRRIIVPLEQVDEVQEALIERLAETVVGNPAEGSVGMGPLATAGQLDEALTGLTELGRETRRVYGTGERVDGTGNPPGKGFFLGPNLLRLDDAAQGAEVHRREVFGPVATLIPYDGSAAEAAKLVGRAEGTLVTSLYSDARDFVGEFLLCGGATTGRLYVGSEKVAGQLPGSGVTLPQVVHGGPGRAGGGEELGGMRGVELYLHRVAVTGDRALVERVSGARS